MKLALVWLTSFACALTFLTFRRARSPWALLEPALVWATVLTLVWFCLSDYPVVEP